MRLRDSRLRRAATAVARSLLVAVALVGCATDMDRASPPPTGQSVVPSSPTPIPTDPNATSEPGVPSQSDTEWGRIWDGLPDGFPEYPGAAPTETGEGPASAILDVGDVDPAEVAGYYIPALEFLGYSTLSRSDPREDGSLQVEWAGETSCRIQATITPLGGTTIVAILYGSSCPFE
jgi:hypothetical protein